MPITTRVQNPTITIDNETGDLNGSLDPASELANDAARTIAAGIEQDMFQGYGSDQSVAISGGVLTAEVIEEAAQAAASQSGWGYTFPQNGATSYTVYRGSYSGRYEPINVLGRYEPVALWDPVTSSVIETQQNDHAIEPMAEIIRGFMKDE